MAHAPHKSASPQPLSTEQAKQSRRMPEPPQAQAEQMQAGQMQLAQRTFGNQGILRRMKAGLRIGDVNDPAEREADRVAQAVVSGRGVSAVAAPAPTVTVQRKCAGCEEEEEAIPLQRKESEAEASPQASQIVGQVLRSPGQPLDAGTRDAMEGQFRENFGQVRVHNGSAAANSARSVGATAYTVGHNIVFDSGSYHPEKTSGMRLLAHELAHVVQQRKSTTAAAPLQRQTPEEQRKQDEELRLRASSLKPGQIVLPPSKSLDETLAAAGFAPLLPEAAPAAPSGRAFPSLPGIGLQSSIQAAQLLDIQSKLAQRGIGLNGPVPAPAPAPSPRAHNALPVLSLSPDWGPRCLSGFAAALAADDKLAAAIAKLSAQLSSTSGKLEFVGGFSLGLGSGAVTSILDIAYVPFKLYVETSSMSPDEVRAAFEKFKAAILKASVLVLSSEPEAIGQISAQLVSGQLRQDFLLEEGRAPLQSPIDVVNGRPHFNLPSSLSDVAQAALSVGAPAEAGQHVYNKGLAMGQAVGSALMNIVLLFVGVEELKGLVVGADALNAIKEGAVGKKLSSAFEAIPEVQKVITGKRLETAAKVAQAADKEVPAVVKDVAEARQAASGGKAALRDSEATAVPRQKNADVIDLNEVRRQRAAAELQRQKGAASSRARKIRQPRNIAVGAENEPTVAVFSDEEIQESFEDLTTHQGQKDQLNSGDVPKENVRNTRTIRPGEYDPAIGDSGLLGERLTNNGSPRPGEGYQAHHIVPSNEPEATELRDFLRRRGFTDINDADNGVWLPTHSQTANLGAEFKHEFTFDNAAFNGEYFKRLETILMRDPNIGPARIRLKLRGIRASLLQGKLPPGNL